MEQFQAMFKAQGLKCAACGSESPRWIRGWCVDHDHNCCEKTPTCGKCVRGILCMPCNMTAGLMKDNTENMIKLAQYIESKNR